MHLILFGWAFRFGHLSDLPPLHLDDGFFLFLSETDGEVLSFPDHLRMVDLLLHEVS